MTSTTRVPPRADEQAQRGGAPPSPVGTLGDTAQQADEPDPEAD